MSTATVPARRSSKPAAAPAVPVVAPSEEALSRVTGAIETLKAIRTFVAEELVQGSDYGCIPGTDKPTLLLPGAQKIALYFQTRAVNHVERIELGDGHLEIQVRVELVSRESGTTVAEGYGSCSTMESKYRWRTAKRACPSCGVSALARSKAEYGGGWYCNGKAGGCGSKFRADDVRIANQSSGRVENEDVWDLRNTVLKMALKRGLVAAVLTLSSLADRFTQDVEDIFDLEAAASVQPRPEPTAPVSAAAALPPPEPARPAPTRPEPPFDPKAEVNRQFTPPPAAGPRVETWQQYASRRVAETNRAWRDHQAAEGVPEGDHSEKVTDLFRCLNAFVTTAIATEVLTAEEVADPKSGNRDRDKAKAAAERIFRELPAESRNVINAYLSEKLEEGKQSLGIVLGAEDEAGDVAEVLERRGREPGED